MSPFPSSLFRSILAVTWVTSLALALGCASPSGIQPRGLAVEDLPLDLQRFMGNWYVIAHIPTAVEAEAHEAVENYELRDDGRIEVRFLFCDGSSDGPAESLRMLGWVHDAATNAEWRVRPVWPLRLAYQILELDPDYSITVIGHPSGSYAWIMARQPELPEATLSAITGRLKAQGYETDRMRRVPQTGGRCLDRP